MGRVGVENIGRWDGRGVMRMGVGKVRVLAIK